MNPVLNLINQPYPFGRPPNDHIMWIPLLWDIEPKTNEKIYFPATAYGHTCRESLIGSMDLTKLDSSRSKEAIKANHIALLAGSGHTTYTKDKSYRDAGGVRQPGSIKEMKAGMKMAMDFLNSLERKAKWAQTICRETNVTYLKPSNRDKYAIVDEHETVWWVIEGDPRWFSNPYMISMFMLIIRIFFMINIWRMPGLPKRIPGWRTGFEVLRKLDINNPRHDSAARPRPTDLNHYKATYQFWLPLMLNYDKFFEGITTSSAYDSTNYSSGYISINGINLLVAGRTSFNGMKASFVENQESLKTQYQKLMIRKPKKEEKPNGPANSQQ